MPLDSWRDQLNMHADELHELHADIHAQHTDQAAAATTGLDDGIITEGADDQRPPDPKDGPS